MFDKNNIELKEGQKVLFTKTTHTTTAFEEDAVVRNTLGGKIQQIEDALYIVYVGGMYKVKLNNIDLIRAGISDIVVLPEKEIKYE